MLYSSILPLHMLSWGWCARLLWFTVDPYSGGQVAVAVGQRFDDGISITRGHFYPSIYLGSSSTSSTYGCLPSSHTTTPPVCSWLFAGWPPRSYHHHHHRHLAEALLELSFGTRSTHETRFQKSSSSIITHSLIRFRLLCWFIETIFGRGNWEAEVLMVVKNKSIIATINTYLYCHPCEEQYYRPNGSSGETHFSSTLRLDGRVSWTNAVGL